MIFILEIYSTHEITQIYKIIKKSKGAGRYTELWNNWQ